MFGQILLVFATVFAIIAALFTTGYPWRTTTPPLPIWGFHFGWLALAFYFLWLLFGTQGAR